MTTWIEAGACAHRLDLPWTTDLADVTAWDAEAMRSTCAACPVLLDCLAAVDDLDVTGGWWAGHDRDPHTYTVHPDAPTWATSTPDVPAAGTTWQPLRTRHGGPVVAEQAALSLALLTGGAA
ncbi:hypothetical protein [Arsenicicoccus bolidensis]|uniref:4Fe-4S Wbl-type domain-containing protein n=1 Tax=Arsenicicoccus bolidensis TaxID=229480 RepID=A0ABS9Q304_9MICO|nr:hypothetical protein [Arsenicicoccus bolidensis]MCG7321620.1 hypothetical protein [Arsenicicoccus bolidensis]